MGTGLAIILSTIIAGIVTAVGAIASKQSVSNTNQANKDLAGMQNQWNIEQWNRQNAYNTPVQQLQRLNEANLNPALAMTSGNMVESSTADKLESAQPHPMQPYDYAPAMNSLAGNIQDYGLRQAQVDLANSQAEKNNAEAESITTKLPHEVQQIKAQTKELEQGVTNLQKQVDLMSSQIQNMDETTMKTYAERLHIDFLENYYQQNYDLELQKYNTEVKRVKSEISKNYSQSKLNSATAEYYKGLTELSAVDLAYATRTLNYRILETQNNAWNSGLKLRLNKQELQRGEIVLEQLRFNLAQMKLENPIQHSLYGDYKYGTDDWRTHTLHRLYDLGVIGQNVFGGLLSPFKGIFSYSRSSSLNVSNIHTQ